MSQLIKIAQHVQAIQELTKDLPSQYCQKIEELCSTLITVTSMAEGGTVINASDLKEGTNVINGRTIIVKDGEIQLGE